jgi:ATP-dependent protease HslVU (ClpYQ) peptidase subunit
MSTVIGIVDDGKVWMGADSYATTTCGERRRIICEKMFINNRYLIGFIGSVRSGQVLRPEYFEVPENIYEFPDKMMEQFKRKGCLAVSSDTHMSTHESNFLIATPNGKLFEILLDFQINEIKDFTAIGSGSPFALGSLYTTKDWGDHKRRIMTAFKVAAAYDMSTGPPYTIEEFLE